MKFKVKEITENGYNRYYLIYFRFLFFFWLPKKINIYSSPNEIKKVILKIVTKEPIKNIINYLENRKIWFHKNFIIQKVYYPLYNRFHYVFKYDRDLFLFETLDDAIFKINEIKPIKKSRWINLKEL
jgi:hypothetical protein